MVKIFHHKDSVWTPTDYEGSGDIASIKEFCVEFYRGTNQPYSNLPDEYTDGDIIYLDENNFDDVVYSSNEIWIIKFSAPWCYHCNLMKPGWTAAAKEMGSKVRFAVVNADANRSLARRFFIRMLPAIKYYDAGYGKSDESAKSYKEGRSQDELLILANKLRKKYDDDPSKYMYVPKYDIVQELEPKEPEVVDSAKESVENPDKSAMPKDEEVEDEEPEAPASASTPETSEPEPSE